MAVAAFIDRDGVINEERGYVGKQCNFVLLPGVISGLLRLQSLGYNLVIVTNQAGIARGLYAEEDYLQLTRYMNELFSKQGITLSGVYHCPHLPVHGLGKYRLKCECRKPKPGLLFRARDDLDLDLSNSVLIGDKASDLGAGRAAGVQFCVLVRSGHLINDGDIQSADHCAVDLDAAAYWLENKL